jgi:hypothetical protein
VNLDQMTQQNSALVEESAAAATSMREQAGQLATAVAVFKVNASLHGGRAVAYTPAPVPAPVRHTPVAAPAARAPAAKLPNKPMAAPARKAAPAAPVARSLAAPKAKPAAAPAGGEGDWESF